MRMNAAVPQTKFAGNCVWRSITEWCARAGSIGDAATCQSHLLLGQSARPARPRVSRLLFVSPSVALISSCVRHTVLLKRVPVRT